MQAALLIASTKVSAVCARCFGDAFDRLNAFTFFFVLVPWSSGVRVIMVWSAARREERLSVGDSVERDPGGSHSKMVFGTVHFIFVMVFADN